MDKNGDAVPWYTYPAIEFLSGRVRPEMDVFEFGCGNSTIWWAKRCQSVRAVESSQEWLDRVTPRLPKTAHVTYEPRSVDGSFARAVLSGDTLFHVVVVDGDEDRDRVHCAHHALDRLRTDGVVIWDNSDRRDRYAAGFEELTSRGFRELYFGGLGPLNSYGWGTSVFYRDGNCLKL